LPRDTSSRGDARKGSRRAYFPERADYLDTAVYDRYALKPGMQFAGPAIVEETSATTVMDVDGILEVDRYGSLLIAIRGAA